MNVFLVFISCLFLTILSSIKFKNKFLSPTFLSSLMFTIFACAYLVFFNIIGKDISFKAAAIIVFSLIFTFLGEFIPSRVSFRLKEKKDKKIIIKHSFKARRISFNKTFVIFIFILVIAILRYYTLFRFAISKYGSVNLLEVVSVTRTEYALGNVSMGFGLSICYYISLVIAYIYSYFFVRGILVDKKKHYSYLLPILAYCLCVVTTTSRSEYIKLACAFFGSVFIVKGMIGDKRTKWFKLVILSVLFVAFFLIYGFSVRGINYVGKESILSNIVSYSSASLYGLDYYLKNPWDENAVFGMYTLDNFYNLFGQVNFTGYEPTYFMAYSKSNIYTAFVKPIQDYGYFGLFFTRFVMAFVAGLIKKMIFTKTDTNPLFYLWYIIVIHNVYIFLMTPLGDKAYLFYLNPKYLLGLLIALMVCYALNLRLHPRIRKNVLLNYDIIRRVSNENMHSNCNI